MKKLPRGLYSVIFLTLILLSVLIYGFYYENYLKPVDCGSHSINDCPARCAICQACQNCKLACRSIQDCKDSGFYDEKFEQIRTHQALPDPMVAIKEVYEPALKQYPAYDHMVIGECDNTMCVQIYLKENSPDLKSKMPAFIDQMKVVYIVKDRPGVKDAGAEDPGEPGSCVIEDCHGMDIVCGPKKPDACTEIYALGDYCRQFAACAVIDGKCQPAQSKLFDECKACVEKCAIDFAQENEKMFACENDCRQAR